LVGSGNTLCYDARAIPNLKETGRFFCPFHQLMGRLKARNSKEQEMSVAKVTELSASSKTSFEDAIQKGVERADKTLDKVKGAWVNEMKVEVEDGKVTAYRVNMKVTFVLKG
jgi:flavin-binding protein dodecin